MIGVKEREQERERESKRDLEEVRGRGKAAHTSKPGSQAVNRILRHQRRHQRAQCGDGARISH